KAPGGGIDPEAATTALLEGCAPACAGPRPRGADVWTAIAARCGPGALGLGKERAYLASADWWILSRIATWIEATRAEPVDDKQLPAQIEHATQRAAFTLPLPARNLDGRYTLPPSRRGRRSDARIYLIVNAAEIRAGAVPIAHLRGPELAVAAGAGGGFPGSLVDEGQLGQVFAEDVALIGRDRGDASVVPILLVDAHATVARVATVFAELGVSRAEIGVAGVAAEAHPVVIERATSENAAAPSLVVHDPSGAGSIALQGFGDDRATTWAGLDDELDHFAAVNAPVRRLALVTDGTVTAQQLVQILDACARAHVASLVMPAR
ncbi:MAG TPA: hypothetical protein VL463_17810, partial [Kofleriaceae bacterium]|nr:hypothetical protein [Kofleriaceae bacterium]